jgi:hypothetical protein
VNYDRNSNDKAILRSTSFDKLPGVLHDTFHFLTHGGVVEQLLLEHLFSGTGTMLGSSDTCHKQKEGNGKQKFFHNDYFE